MNKKELEIPAFVLERQRERAEFRRRLEEAQLEEKRQRAEKRLAALKKAEMEEKINTIIRTLVLISVPVMALIFLNAIIYRLFLAPI